MFKSTRAQIIAVLVIGGLMGWLVASGAVVESFAQDTRTGVAAIEYRYDSPFKFTSKINKLTYKLEPEAQAAPER